MASTPLVFKSILSPLPQIFDFIKKIWYHYYRKSEKGEI